MLADCVFSLFDAIRGMSLWRGAPREKSRLSASIPPRLVQLRLYYERLVSHHSFFNLLGDWRASYRHVRRMQIPPLACGSLAWLQYACILPLTSAIQLERCLSSQQVEHSAGLLDDRSIWEVAWYVPPNGWTMPIRRPHPRPTADGSEQECSWP